MSAVSTPVRVALDPAVKPRGDNHFLSCRGLTAASRAACRSARVRRAARPLTLSLSREGRGDRTRAPVAASASFVRERLRDGQGGFADA